MKRSTRVPPGHHLGLGTGTCPHDACGAHVAGLVQHIARVWLWSDAGAQSRLASARGREPHLFDRSRPPTDIKLVTVLFAFGGLLESHIVYLGCSMHRRPSTGSVSPHLPSKNLAQTHSGIGAGEVHPPQASEHAAPVVGAAFLDRGAGGGDVVRQIGGLPGWHDGHIPYGHIPY